MSLSALGWSHHTLEQARRESIWLLSKLHTRLMKCRMNQGCLSFLKRTLSHLAVIPGSLSVSGRQSLDSVREPPKCHRVNHGTWILWWQGVTSKADGVQMVFSQEWVIGQKKQKIFQSDKANSYDITAFSWQSQRSRTGDGFLSYFQEHLSRKTLAGPTDRMCLCMCMWFSPLLFCKCTSEFRFLS